MSRLAYLSGALRVSTADDAEIAGPRAHVLGVIDAFAGLGWQVDRYVAGDTSLGRRLGGGGREDAVRTARWKAFAADGLRVTAGLANAAAARSTVKGADLVYERFASFQALGGIVRRRDQPWILETSGPFFHEAREERGTLALSALARRIELGAYGRCDLLVCVSDALRDILVEAGVEPERTYVMPNAVDVERFDPAVVDQSGPTGELVVGFVGTVQAWQGIESLVEAVARCRSRGTAVSAVVVGDGPAVPDARARASALGVDDAVRFVGQVPASSIPGWIASFDVGFSGHLPLLAGRMYHSPLKLYEYMAMGRPLVAADHPEARALVESAGVGALFPAGDVAALADVLTDLDGRRDDLRTGRDHVRSVAVRDHSWTSRVRSLLHEVERRGLL